MTMRHVGMRKWRSVWILLVAGLTTAPADAPSQPPPGSCRQFDDYAENLAGYAEMLASDTTTEIAETRLQYGITPVPPSSVAYVTDEAICRRAALRFNEEAVDEEGRGGDRPDRQVYVVRLGTTPETIRYIVEDPDERAGEFTVGMVFDADFRHLATYAG